MSTTDVLPPADGSLVERSGRREALIPTTQRENHASFLHRLPDGSLAVVWFAGAREGLPDVRIELSRLDEVEGRWSSSSHVSPSSELSHQNPVLATLPDGAVWLLYTAQELGAQDTAVLMRRISLDGGTTWSDPESVLPDRGVFIRQDLIVLDDGTLLLPIFRCVLPPGRQWYGDTDTSALLRSEDGGRSWAEVPIPGSLGLVHMNVVPFQDGQLVAFFRSRWADAVHRSTSTDGGRSWSEPVPLDLPNNNSSIQMRRAPLLGAESILAVLNPVSAEAGSEDGDIDRPLDEHKKTAPGPVEPLERHAVWGVDRVPLTLLRSDDRGMTWQRVMDLERENEVPDVITERAGDRAGEMSYPAILVDEDGDVHVTYSYCRLGIKHVVIPRAALGENR